MPKRTRKGGLDKMAILGKDLWAAKAALDRALGVLFGGPTWIIGSLLGNPWYAAWLGYLYDALSARMSDILAASGTDRVPIVASAVKEAKSKFAEAVKTNPKAVYETGRTILGHIRTLAEEIASMLAPVREIVRLIPAAVPAV